MDAAERRQQDRDRLQAAVEALQSSEGFQRWLEARAKFHTYSFNNQLLIAMQRPDAERVAGYKTWQTLGRQVLKGEKSIRIMAPIGGKCKGCDGKGSKVFDGQRLTCGKCMGGGKWGSFKMVSVFDVSQTEGEELPELGYEPLEGDSHAHLIGKLVAYAEEQRLTVTFQEDTGRMGGWFSPSENAIVVNSTKSPNQQVGTLIHELAHSFGVGYDEYSREDAEAIVESVAYSVCRCVGLEADRRSVPYIAGWATDADTIKKYAKTIDELAKKLEAAVS